MQPRKWSLAMLLLAGTAVAQDGGSQLDRIEVTGSRLTYDELLGTPAIAITRPGDYLLQEVRLVNDSRDAATRKRELHETIAALLAAAPRDHTVLHGSTYRIALDAGNHRVEVEKDEKRADTSTVSVYLRAPVGAQPSEAEQRIRALRDFASGTRRVGRTEIDLVGETALGMNRPERFRYELLDAIANDARRVTESMQMECRIELEGLNSRLEWERVSAAELLLYIPYTMTIKDCEQRPARDS
jgi:hypothetical protein